MEVIFTCFGTPDYSIARTVYQSGTQKFGFRSFIYDIDSDPIKEARKDNPSVFESRRGYGYWFWKPYIIEATMKASAPGDLIFYTDIAVRMDNSPQKLIDYIKDWDFATFRVGQGYPQREFTKRDCFVLLNADEKRFWDDEQSNGAYSVFRNCEAGRKFVSEWKDYMRDPRMLTDQPNTQKLPNLPGFVDHRHDQSILSIMATRDKLPLLRDPSQWGNDGSRATPDFKVSDRFDSYDFGQIFFHHRQRDGQIR